MNHLHSVNIVCPLSPSLFAIDILLVRDKQKHWHRIINNNGYNAIIIAPGGV